MTDTCDSFACMLTPDGRRQIIRMDQIVHGFVSDGRLFVGVENTSGTQVATLDNAGTEGPFMKEVTVRAAGDAIRWLAMCVPE